jgi:hypothetical protein
MINHCHHISISRPYHQFLITTPPPERCLLAPASARPHQVSTTGTLRKKCKKNKKIEQNSGFMMIMMVSWDSDDSLLFYWMAITSRLPMTHHWHIVAPQRSPASVLHQPPSLRVSPIRMLTWRHGAHGAHRNLEDSTTHTMTLESNIN